jgi:hydroxyacylglutathione hydrolase
MHIKIHTVNLGFDQCYLIQGDGIIMIDGGEPGKIEKFKKSLKKLEIKPEEIKLIILTHGHWDHIGSAKDIQKLTGTKIVMHENEKEWLEKSLIILPPGATTWGQIFNKIMSLFVPLIKVPPANVDIVLNEENFSLTEFGIPGYIEYTPGHSSGSVSIILDTGEAFVGDLLMNKFPLRMSPGLPIFAEDIEEVKQSLEILLEKEVKTIYPSHGKPFSAKIISKELEKLRNKIS